MKRDYRKNPKCILSAKERMKKFIDCLNNAKIFNENIPYLIIKQKEERINSKMELELTFKENINSNAYGYIIKKLDNLSKFDFEYGDPITTIIDKTDEECYKSYIVAFVAKESVNKTCKLAISMYNKDIPQFELEEQKINYH